MCTICTPEDQNVHDMNVTLLSGAFTIEAIGLAAPSVAERKAGRRLFKFSKVARNLPL